MHPTEEETTEEETTEEETTEEETTEEATTEEATTKVTSPLYPLLRHQPLPTTRSFEETPVERERSNSENSESRAG